MSSATTDLTEGRQQTGGQAGLGYIPTDEERKVFQECNHESFWYRSVPLSAISIVVTQALVSKGVLSASPRFGSIPKLAFAGFCGYLFGKMTYMKECQEKFKRLSNSPLGESLRQRQGLPPPNFKGAQSEMSDPDTLSFDPMFQPAGTPGQRGYNTEPVMQMGRSDDYSAPASVESRVDDDEPRRKAILYEDLRMKNRENYEVTLTHKSETLLKPSPEKEPTRPKKEMKNAYGDTWEE
ncbi:OCIA domain-containing protein 1 [Pagrus major]|uniref:OCIA domain-containing protein 1 n=1 Tax=Pagrus major TaxID=143350 RepID=UPI003CC86106